MRALMKDRLKCPADDQVGDAGHEGGAGDGENPGDEDALAPNPADGADALGGADAENRAGDGVGGGDGDAVNFGEAEEGDGGGAFGAEAADGLKAGDGMAEGFDDAPAAEKCAECDSAVAGENDPPGD